MTGVIGLSVVPGRKEPNDRSEMITQLLFGEEYMVLEEKEKWVKIKGTTDDYECWIDKKLHLPAAHSEFVMHTVWIGEHWINTESMDTIDLCPGSIIREEPTFHPSFEGEIELVLLSEDENIPDGEKVFHVANQFINSPYLWGGKTSMGIDCSGFTQVVMRTLGFSLKRDAWQQGLEGDEVQSIHEVQEGDLAFFCSADNNEADAKITHVGIVFEEGLIIHASGFVRIDPLDKMGIFNPEEEKYSHRLLGIRRIQ